MTTTDDAKGTNEATKFLADTGHVFVTLAAARAFAEHEHLQLEEARRELTELLLDAHPSGTPEPGRPERWRARRKSTGLDVQAHVAREGRLAVVTHINVRGFNSSGGRGR